MLVVAIILRMMMTRMMLMITRVNFLLTGMVAVLVVGLVAVLVVGMVAGMVMSLAVVVQGMQVIGMMIVMMKWKYLSAGDQGRN